MRRQHWNLIGIFMLAVAMAGCSSGGGSSAASAAPSKPGSLAYFRAFAVERVGGMSGVVQITIERWTTDAERQSLLDTLKAQGQKATLAELMKLPQVGYIQMPGSLGYALFYARQNPQPDGSRNIVIATDRALSAGQVVAQSLRTNEYGFSVVEIHMPKTGEGEGKIVGSAKVEIDPATQKIAVQNYSGEPVSLMRVTEGQ
jgi:hypothetical protein